MLTIFGMKINLLSHQTRPQNITVVVDRQLLGKVTKHILYHIRITNHSPLQSPLLCSVFPCAKGH